MPSVNTCARKGRLSLGPWSGSGRSSWPSCCPRSPVAGRRGEGPSEHTGPHKELAFLLTKLLTHLESFLLLKIKFPSTPSGFHTASHTRFTQLHPSVPPASRVSPSASGSRVLLTLPPCPRLQVSFSPASRDRGGLSLSVPGRLRPPCYHTASVLLSLPNCINKGRKRLRAPASEHSSVWGLSCSDAQVRS